MKLLIPDGLVRIGYADLANFCFQPYLAWQDACLSGELQHQGLPAVLAGYSEWISYQSPQPLSIGWAWFSCEYGTYSLAPCGFSTNLMLCDCAGYDLGQQRTEAMLDLWLKTQDWQNKTRILVDSTMGI
ncbi:hypothetical protein JCM19000A_12750 [Silvimonas sp. JCM 19000]